MCIYIYICVCIDWLFMLVFIHIHTRSPHLQPLQNPLRDPCMSHSKGYAVALSSAQLPKLRYFHLHRLVLPRVLGLGL